MLATSFTCPECGTLLKLATPVPAGKKIKCPKCTGIFTMPEGDVRPSTPVSPYGGLGSPPSTRESAEPDYPATRDASPHIRPYSDQPADYDRGVQAGAPVRPRRERSVVRAPEKSRAGLTVGLILGGIVLAFGVFAFAAWVWPGFWKKATPVQGEGTEELWAFIPGDCNVFMGVDTTATPKASNQPLTPQQEIQMAFQQFPNLPPGITEFLEILSDAEKILFAVKIPSDGNQNNALGVGILKTKHPYNPDKIRQLCKAGDPQALNGKTYYELKEFAGQPIKEKPGVTARPYLCMLTNRVLMLAFVPKDRLGEVVAAEGAKPRLPPNTLTWLREVDKSAFWMVLPFEGLVGRQLQQVQPEHFAQAPELKKAVGPLQHAKAAWMTGSQLSNEGVRFEIGLVCSNEADASQLITSMQNFWNSNQLKSQFDLAKIGLERQGMGAFNRFIDEFRKALEFTTRGTTAVVSVDFSKSLMEDFAREMQKMGNPFLRRNR